MSEETLPPGWASIQLKEIARSRMGKTILKSDLTETGVPVYSAGASSEPWGFLEGCDVRYGADTLVISARGNIGMPKRPRQVSFVCTQTTIACTVHIPEIVDWLFWFLSRFDYSTKSSQTTIPMLRTSDVDSFHVPLPPLNEQKRIVAKIEELFSELEAGEESLRMARRQLGVYRQSLLKQAFEGRLTETWRTQNPAKLESPTQLLARIQSARQRRSEKNDSERDVVRKGIKLTKIKALRSVSPFTAGDIAKLATLPTCWAREKLGRLFRIVSGHTPKNISHTEGGAVPYYRVSDMNTPGNELRMRTSSTWLTEAQCEELGLHIYPERTVIFPKRGGAILTNKKRVLSQPACFDLNTMGVINDETSIDSDFLRWWFMKLDLSKIYDGSNIPQINNKNVEHLPFELPSLPEQQEIVRVLNAQFEEIERNEREIDGALRKSEALRQAILKKAFTGRLVRQSAADEPTVELLARLHAERTATPEAKKKTRKIITQPDAGDWFPEVAGTQTKPKKPHAARQSGKTDLQAGIVALAIDRFGKRHQFLGHTGAEKIVHLADCLADLQLDRQPVKDAAGPNDFKRAHEIEHRARMKGWFTVTQDGSVYHHHAGHNMPSLIAATQRELGPKFAIVENLLEQLGSLKDTKAIEIFATVFAAWNNLLLLKTAITDEAIVTEARENWHKRKLEIPRERFFNAIVWMKKKGFAPNGSGQLVSAPKS